MNASVISIFQWRMSDLCFPSCSDPMWGRNSEAYSECPFLTGEFAAAVIRGMRSDERGAGKYIQAFGGV